MTSQNLESFIPSGLAPVAIVQNGNVAALAPRLKNAIYRKVCDDSIVKCAHKKWAHAPAAEPELLHFRVRHADEGLQAASHPRFFSVFFSLIILIVSGIAIESLVLASGI